MAAIVDTGRRLSTTLLLGAAAVAMALIAIFGEDDSITVSTAVAALVGLLPWALVVGGVDVPTPLFAAMVFVPAAWVVLVGETSGGMFPLMLLVVWVTRVARQWWLIAATVAASAAVIVARAVDEGSSHETGMVYFLGGLFISWLTGALLRRQEQLMDEVQAMHELQVEQLGATERARIARDVHDVVAHSLTIVMLNVTGARRALANQPERADEALERAERIGRESLDSIRQVMGLLREPGSGTDLPQPGLTALPTLVEGYRAAGMDVAASLDVDCPGIDATLQLVVYRLVQESLSNVLQHAPGALATVRVSAEPSLVRAEVRNGPPASTATPAPTPTPWRAGLGVRGMVERVRALGGEVQAGPDAGGWLVAAAIPVRAGHVAISAEPAWVAPTG